MLVNLGCGNSDKCDHTRVALVGISLDAVLARADLQGLTRDDLVQSRRATTECLAGVAMAGLSDLYICGRRQAAYQTM